MAIRLRNTVACLLLAAGLVPDPSARAQQNANPPEVMTKEIPPPFRIRTERNVVTVRVVVRDREGHAVGNLTKSDFRLLDNGKLQDISSFAVETAADGSAAAAPAGSAHTTAPQPTLPPQRFVGLFFDDLHLTTESVQRTRDAAWRYVTTEAGPADRVALFTASHQDDLDFSGDRSVLRDALFRIVSRTRVRPQVNDCPEIGEYQAFRIDQRQDPEAIGIAADEAFYCDCVRMDNESPACPIEAHDRVMFEADQIWNLADLQAQNALDRIAAALNRLAAMAGRRALVLVSPGFLTETHSAELEALIHGSLRRDVMISAIDAAGLEPSSPRPMADPRNPNRATQKDMIYQEGEKSARDILANLTGGTGGVFFRNSNDLGEAFREAAAAPPIAYVLGFSPEDFKLDGKFHSLTVALSAKKPWSVEARRGYFDPTQALAEQTPGQEELDKLMFSSDVIQALPVEVSAHADMTVHSPATLTVVIHVGLHDLQFRQEGDRSVNTLFFDTALFDNDGKYVSGKEESFDLHLKEATLKKFERRGINLTTSFQVPPGVYSVREVVRDAVAQRLSALSCEAVVTGAKASAASSGSASKRPQSADATKAMADWTPAQFEQAIPELKGLAPAASQDRLPLILAKAGDKVKAFFATLPDTTAREEIVLERLDWTGHQVEISSESFNYLDVAGGSRSGALLQEYRTDAKGRRTEPAPLNAGFLTHGFASLPIHFHPDYQQDSTFRYLGGQNLHGRSTEVVYFSQIPGKARIDEMIRTPNKSVDVLVQGIAWIDAESYQIVRMQTDIVFPLGDPDLTRVTTDSTFAEVHFRDDPQGVWLPAEVTVTVGWGRESFRNRHRYSHFELFRIATSTSEQAQPAVER